MESESSLIVMKKFHINKMEEKDKIRDTLRVYQPCVSDKKNNSQMNYKSNTKIIIAIIKNILTHRIDKGSYEYVSQHE